LVKGPTPGGPDAADWHLQDGRGITVRSISLVYERLQDTTLVAGKPADRSPQNHASFHGEHRFLR
jgi:hypothetical protein